MATRVIDLKEGDRLNIRLLVFGLTKGVTNSGAPYLSLVLQDCTKQIEAKLWDVKPEVEKELTVGRVFDFEMEINRYRGVLQAKVIRVLPVNQAEIDINAYLSQSSISKEVLHKNIEDGVNSINNTNLALLVNALLNYYGNDFYDYPAASKIHHNFIGGLATHVSGMLKLAYAIVEIYPLVNRDYLVAGVIVHDLGKIEELTSPIVTEYSTTGKLLGHISILDARLLEVAKQLHLEDSEELLILRHMVLAHHGQYEYGSPVLPETVEAEMLTFVDNIDARINIMDKALADIQPGEFTQKVFALDNRCFYKHK